jgi:hypothetical protein
MLEGWAGGFFNVGQDIVVCQNRLAALIASAGHNTAIPADLRSDIKVGSPPAMNVSRE